MDGCLAGAASGRDSLIGVYPSPPSSMSLASLSFFKLLHTFDERSNSLLTYELVVKGIPHGHSFSTSLGCKATSTKNVLKFICLASPGALTGWGKIWRRCCSVALVVVVIIREFCWLKGANFQFTIMSLSTKTIHFTSTTWTIPSNSQDCNRRELWVKPVFIW